MWLKVFPSLLTSGLGQLGNRMGVRSDGDYGIPATAAIQGRADLVH